MSNDTVNSNDKIRHISNTKYKKCIWIGSVTIVVTIIFLIVIKNFPNLLTYSVLLYLFKIKTSFIFIGLFLIGLGSIQCKNIKDKNSWLSNLPYPLDLEKEIYTHSNIGRKPKKIKFGAIIHPNYISWKKQILIDYSYLLNEEFELDEENSYITSEKRNLEKEIVLDDYRENFFRYLNAEYRFTEFYVDTIKSIMIPLEAGVVGVFCNDRDIFSSLVLNIVLIIMILLEVVKTDNSQKFIKDFVEITYDNRPLG